MGPANTGPHKKLVGESGRVETREESGSGSKWGKGTGMGGLPGAGPAPTGRHLGGAAPPRETPSARGRASRRFGSLFPTSSLHGSPSGYIWAQRGLFRPASCRACPIPGHQGPLEVPPPGAGHAHDFEGAVGALPVRQQLGGPGVHSVQGDGELRGGQRKLLGQVPGSAVRTQECPRVGLVSRLPRLRFHSVQLLGVSGGSEDADLPQDLDLQEADREQDLRQQPAAEREGDRELPQACNLENDCEDRDHDSGGLAPHVQERRRLRSPGGGRDGSDDRHDDRPGRGRGSPQGSSAVLGRQAPGEAPRGFEQGQGHQDPRVDSVCGGGRPQGQAAGNRLPVQDPHALDHLLRLLQAGHFRLRRGHHGLLHQKRPGGVRRLFLGPLLPGEGVQPQGLQRLDLPEEVQQPPGLLSRRPPGRGGAPGGPLRPGPTERARARRGPPEAGGDPPDLQGLRLRQQGRRPGGPGARAGGRDSGPVQSGEGAPPRRARGPGLRSGRVRHGAPQRPEHSFVRDLGGDLLQAGAPVPQVPGEHHWVLRRGALDTYRDREVRDPVREALEPQEVREGGGGLSAGGGLHAVAGGGPEAPGRRGPRPFRRPEVQADPGEGPLRVPLGQARVQRVRPSALLGKQPLRALLQRRQEPGREQAGHSPVSARRRLCFPGPERREEDILQPLQLDGRSFGRGAVLDGDRREHDGLALPAGREALAGRGRAEVRGRGQHLDHPQRRSLQQPRAHRTRHQDGQLHVLRLLQRGDRLHPGGGRTQNHSPQPLQVVRLESGVRPLRLHRPPDRLEHLPGQRPGPSAGGVDGLHLGRTDSERRQGGFPGRAEAPGARGKPRVQQALHVRAARGLFVQRPLAAPGAGLRDLRQHEGRGEDPQRDAGRAAGHLPGLLRQEHHRPDHQPVLPGHDLHRQARHVQALQLHLDRGRDSRPGRSHRLRVSLPGLHDPADLQLRLALALPVLQAHREGALQVRERVPGAQPELHRQPAEDKVHEVWVLAVDKREDAAPDAAVHGGDHPGPDLPQVLELEHGLLEHRERGGGDRGVLGPRAGLLDVVRPSDQRLVQHVHLRGEDHVRRGEDLPVPGGPEGVEGEGVRREAPPRGLREAQVAFTSTGSAWSTTRSLWG
ncbi:hypothetical protein HWI79_3689 [Cryptosporidium felis]|nr:hypothetical protein HWI79_3689 [Cryptosporidium felis]